MSKNTEGNANDLHSVAVALKRLAPNLPKMLKYRILNSLNHAERANEIFEIDREMSSFRAICGQEESAASVIHALRLRAYDNAKLINPRNHVHKNAILAVMFAVEPIVAPVLAEFQLQFDFSKNRIDLKVPLSNFGIEGGESVAIQPVEPLEMVFSQPDESDPFSKLLLTLASKSGFETVKDLVKERSNQRNSLLYASDESLPISRAKREDITNRASQALALNVISIMIVQTKEQQNFIKQLMPSLCSIITRVSNST